MVLGVGLLFCIGLVLVHKPNQSTDNPSNTIRTPTMSETESHPAPQSIPVSALKLYTDYHQNEVAADNVYKGTRLAVQGQVREIRKDFLDNIVVELATFNEFENVDANLNSEVASIAAQLQIGEIVTVTCTGAGMVVGSPILKDCSIQRTQVDEIRQQQQAEQAQVANQQESPNGLYKVGNGVSAPVPLNTVQVQYTDEARQNKLQGTVLVSLVVNTEGTPQGATIVRSLDPGLDEKALEAVQQYKFTPAIEQQTGKPVPVEITLEVNFKLY
jgi:TonB family protein